MVVMPPAAVISCEVVARRRAEPGQVRSLAACLPYRRRCRETPLQYGSSSARITLSAVRLMERFGPALHHDAAAFGIERDDQPFDTHCRRPISIEPSSSRLMPVRVEGRSPDDYPIRRRTFHQFRRAPGPWFARRLRPAMLAREAIRRTPRWRSFSPWPRAASRSIAWISGKALEPGQHLLQCRRAFESLVAPLHELDDLAVHQVDAGDNHACAPLLWWGGTPVPR